MKGTLKIVLKFFGEHAESLLWCVAILLAGYAAHVYQSMKNQPAPLRQKGVVLVASPAETPREETASPPTMERVPVSEPTSTCATRTILPDAWRKDNPETANDSFTKIARHAYGEEHEYLWPQIAEANGVRLPPYILRKDKPITVPCLRTSLLAQQALPQPPAVREALREQPAQSFAAPEPAPRLEAGGMWSSVAMIGMTIVLDGPTYAPLQKDAIDVKQLDRGVKFARPILSSLPIIPDQIPHPFFAER